MSKVPANSRHATADSKPSAPAALRNRESILEVLLAEFADRRRVLEIGSGTGEHAIFFAPRLHWLSWQTSDREMNHPGIHAWLAEASIPNVHPPLVLDVSAPPELDADYDGLFSANTAHIMSKSEVRNMFALAGRVLSEKGKFCLYGPFNMNGRFTSESNARFDASLKSQHDHMGIRDLEWLDELASQENMTRRSLVAMPANNFLAVWSLP